MSDPFASNPGVAAGHSRAGAGRLPRRTWALLGFLFVLVQILIARLGLPPEGRLLAGDEHMYLRLARDWAAGGDRAIDPLWPPGYPALFAAWLRHAGSEVWFLALQGVALLAAGLLLARIAFRLSGDLPAATLAGAFLLGAPQIAAFAQYYWPEAIHLALGLAIFDVALLEPPDRPRALLLGALGGIALLFKPVLLPVLPVLVALQAWRGTERRLARPLLALAALLLAVAPTALSNHRRYGIVGVSDSVSFNLILGLTETNPRSLDDRTPRDLQLEYLGSAPDVRGRRAWLSRRLHELVTTLDLRAQLRAQVPRQLFRLFDRESEFSALAPGGSLHARGRGYRSPPAGLASALVAWDWALYALLLATAPWGLALLLQERARAGAVILGWLLFLLASFSLLHVDVRYRTLVLPALILASAHALARRRRWGLRAWQGAAAVVASLALLWLAFSLR